MMDEGARVHSPEFIVCIGPIDQEYTQHDPYFCPKETYNAKNTLDSLLEINLNLKRRPIYVVMYRSCTESEQIIWLHE